MNGLETAVGKSAKVLHAVGIEIGKRVIGSAILRGHGGIANAEIADVELIDAEVVEAGEPA